MTELIAEVASNHGGSMSLAKEFIWRFAEAGATFVKFQHTRVRHLIPSDPQLAWFERSEFSLGQFQELKAECERAGVKFLTTVYNAQDVPEVASLGLEAVKVGSGESDNVDLARAILAAQFQRVFVSVGIVTPRWEPWRIEATFFHCVTRYPAPPGCVHMFTFDPHVWWGWSDHVTGIGDCQLAILKGATIIEKHVQLPNQARPCQPWEATVDEFKQLRAFADDDPSRFLKRWQA